MNQDFSQMNIATCKKHPEMIICFIYCKKECPYQSRLACSKCMKSYNTFAGFEEVLDVLNDPKVIQQEKYQSDWDVFSILNEYFKLLESDGEVFIRLLKEEIQKQIQKLEQDLKEGIEKYKKFKEEIQQTKKLFQEVYRSLLCQQLGHDQLRQAFKDILKKEMYHESQEWQQFEQKVQNFVLFDKQKTEKFKLSSQKLMLMEQTFLQPKLLSDIRNREYNRLSQPKIPMLNQFQGCSTPCDSLYFYELINKISNNKRELPQLKLIFKASQDGMNAKAFWDKCNNSGPTIIFCKSKSGHVFGGYTPLKWQKENNTKYYDDSKSSFVFSYTRKEIYPIIGRSTIFCDANFGPCYGTCLPENYQNKWQSCRSFGSLFFDKDFLYGGSNIPQKSNSFGNYNILNSQTYLMGGETPQLVEMEVFQIDGIYLPQNQQSIQKKT